MGKTAEGCHGRAEQAVASRRLMAGRLALDARKFNSSL
jgi:hypothetical protein